MDKHFNGLTPAEAERLAILMEEMGEVQQIIGKILRHGYNSRHPDGGPTNRSLLERELGDLEFAVENLCRKGDVMAARITAFARAKSERIYTYMHHDMPAGYCELGNTCVCMGDTPGVRATCSSWRKA